MRAYYNSVRVIVCLFIAYGRAWPVCACACRDIETKWRQVFDSAICVVFYFFLFFYSVANDGMGSINICTVCVLV